MHGTQAADRRTLQRVGIYHKGKEIRGRTASGRPWRYEPSSYASSDPANRRPCAEIPQQRRAPRGHG